MKKSIKNVLSLFAILGLASCSQVESTPENNSSATNSIVSENNSEVSTSEITSNEIQSSSENPTYSISASDTSKDRLPNTEGNYYANVDLTLKDAAFRKSLSKIINTGFISKSYAQAYEIIADTDEDPNDKTRCICLYTGDSLKKGDHSNTTGYNREHVWAKSHGFPKSGKPYSDVHHLRVTGMKINSTRGNSDFYEFGEKEAFKVYGKNKYTGSNFEPRDEVKGDVARMMFYMATMYGFDGHYNLTLTTDKTTSGSTGNGKFGNIETLVKWSLQDPVSEVERFRNEVVYKEQKNRNPYIDHPEYVLNAYPQYAEKYAGKINPNPQPTPDPIVSSTSEETTSSDITTSIETINEVKGNVTIDLTNNGLANSFVENATVNANGYKVIASVGAGANKGEPVGLKVGINGPKRGNYKTTINDEEFVATLRIDNTIFKNITGVKYTTSCAWDNIDYKVYFFDGNTYTEVSKGSLEGTGKNGATQSTIEAVLDTPKDGTFVLAITNKTSKGCRLNVTEIAIQTKQD